LDRVNKTGVWRHIKGGEKLGGSNSGSMRKLAGEAYDQEGTGKLNLSKRSDFIKRREPGILGDARDWERNCEGGMSVI